MNTMVKIPCSINNVVKINDCTINLLNEHNYGENVAISINRIRNGGTLSDLNYAWFSNGPHLEVVHTKTGRRVSSWTFGAVLQDPETYIACVTDIPRSATTANNGGRAPLLLVGLQCELSGGMICVFDSAATQVLRTVQIDDKITSMYVVDSGCDSSVPGVLRAFDGVLGIGTTIGKVLLIDLCRQTFDEGNVNDEINPFHLYHVSLHDLKKLEQHKEIALKTGDHLCLQLNESCTSGPHFILKGQNGEDRLHAAKDEVIISALCYSMQLGSLFVGYNFGAFQLYNLLSIRLEFTSLLYNDCIPVAQFAIQEPVDDPRAFCYVWIVYSNNIVDYPDAVMYALSYNTKEFMEDYGYLYQELKSCSPRFKMQLKQHELIKNAIGARCVSMRTYNKNSIPSDNNTAHLKHEERLAICVFVSTVWNGNNETETMLYLFDLNQWYKEQMPLGPQCSDDDDDDVDKYLIHVSLTELLNSNVFDLKFDVSSLNQFSSAQRLEEHYYPSSLAFKCVCVCENDLIWINSLGQQRHLLSSIEETDPVCLLRPTEIFQQCIASGLLPLYTDIPQTTSASLNLQREMVLNVALENQLISWLCHCAQEWTNDRYASADCTLDFLIDWAWRRANTLRTNAHKLCVPLFDYSGARLDTNALIQLNYCTWQLKHICTLFHVIVNNCTTFLSKESTNAIESQWNSLQMISVYLEVLQWLLNVGLLPECPLFMYPRQDDLERMSVPYPIESLTRFYKCRRTELHRSLIQKSIINTESQMNDIDSGCDLLFIDNLIDLECGGHTLREQWQKTDESGSGLYPPPSLQALLRTYLIDNVSIVHKHSLFIYVFLDLAMTLDKSRYASIIAHLIKFPAVFKLSPSIIKITQALWQLDHGDFSTAITQLLDPLVKTDDLKYWHHRTVLHALLVQGQYQHALLYYQVRKPPVSCLEDIHTVITLFVFNNMLQEAYEFQRRNQDSRNEEALLTHFFEVCNKANQLAALVQLPLCRHEEKAFIKYLSANRCERNDNLLVIYFLQRDRHMEAFDINEHFTKSNRIYKQGLQTEYDTRFCDVIVKGFKKTLPQVTQNLLEYCKNFKDTTNSNASSKNRPVPMSVFIHDSKEHAKYKSTIIEASLQKARETWTESSLLDEMPFISSPKMTPGRMRKDASSIIHSSLIHCDENKTVLDKSLDEATPRKKMKLNTTVEENQTPLSLHSVSLLNTPIVKRKSYRIQSDVSLGEDFNDMPSGILKVSMSSSKRNNTLQFDENESIEHHNTTLLNTPVSKSYTEISSRPAVRFHGMKQVLSEEEHNEQIDRQETLEEPSKNSSLSTTSEEVFYSPHASLSDSTATTSSLSHNVSENQPSTENSVRLSLKRKASDNSIKSRPSYQQELSSPLQRTETFTLRRSTRKKSLAQQILGKYLTTEKMDTTVTTENTEKITITTPEGKLSNIYSENLTPSSDINDSFIEKFSFNKLISTPCNLFNYEESPSERQKEIEKYKELCVVLDVQEEDISDSNEDNTSKVIDNEGESLNEQQEEIDIQQNIVNDQQKEAEIEKNREDVHEEIQIIDVRHVDEDNCDDNVSEVLQISVDESMELNTSEENEDLCLRIEQEDIEDANKKESEEEDIYNFDEENLNTNKKESEEEEEGKNIYNFNEENLDANKEESEEDDYSDEENLSTNKNENEEEDDENLKVEESSDEVEVNDVDESSEKETNSETTSSEDHSNKSSQQSENDDESNISKKSAHTSSSSSSSKLSEEIIELTSDSHNEDNISENESHSQDIDSISEKDSQITNEQSELNTSSSKSEEVEIDTKQQSDTSKLKRTRSLSVTDLPTNVNSKGKRRTRASSVASEPVAIETVDSTKKLNLSQKMDQYLATHRLTRRQRQLMEESMKRAEERVSTNVILEQKEEEEEKEEEEDKEQHQQQKSAPIRSSARIRNKRQSSLDESASSISTIRRMDEESVDEENNESIDELGNIRPRRKSFTAAQQALTTPVKRKRIKRTQSQDSDDASSVVSMPVTRNNSKQDHSERHRSLSPTLLKENEKEKKEKVTLKPQRRMTRRTSALPEIQEESQESEQNIEISGEEEEEEKEKPNRRESVRQSFAPRYSALNTRKSFKIKKLRRKMTDE